MFFLHSVSAVVDALMHHLHLVFFNCRKCNLEKISHLYNIPSTLRTQIITSTVGCFSALMFTWLQSLSVAFHPWDHSSLQQAFVWHPPTPFDLEKKTEWVGVEAWYCQCTSILPNLYTVVTLTFILTAASPKNMHNGRILWLFLISIALQACQCFGTSIFRH